MTLETAKEKKPMATKRLKGLGRGLDALLGSDKAVIGSLDQPPTADGAAPPATLALAQLRPGRYQPRTRMDEGALAELAESIRSQGIMQPILVRPVAGSKNQYEIIAGERRYRAAQLAGLTQVPVLVREVADENAAAMALIENIQREDLNPLEEAHGVKRLLDEFNYTHEQAAQAISRSRSATSNLLRLLNLCEPVQTMLLAGDIDMGHARALLSLEAAQQILAANEIIARRLSVREAERLVGRALRDQGGRRAAPGHAKTQPSGDAQRLERALADLLGTKVSLKVGARNKGQLIIDFHDWDHLNALLERQGLGSVLEA
jgi:ParB family chromosome partitioning protein